MVWWLSQREPKAEAMTAPRQRVGAMHGSAVRTVCRSASLATCIIVCFLTLQSARSQAEPLPEQLTRHNILDYVRDNDVTNVEDFIAALPDMHRTRNVFVFESGGLARDFVSGDRPRVAAWGADGRFVMSWGTDSESPFYEGVEFLEAAEDRWIAGVIDFSGDEVEIREPAVCSTCHGHLNKPLWGQFQQWRGTEGGENNRVSGEVSRWVGRAARSQDRRLSLLQFEYTVRVTLPGEDGLVRWLTFRDEVTNEVSDAAEVAREASSVFAWRHAEVLFGRIAGHDDYAAMARGMVCGDTSGFEAAVPPEDHHLSVLSDSGELLLGNIFVGSPPLRPYGYGYGDLYDSVRFLVLHDLFRRDARVGRALAGSEDRLRRAHRRHFSGVGGASLVARLGASGGPLRSGLAMGQIARSLGPLACSALGQEGGGLDGRAGHDVFVAGFTLVDAAGDRTLGSVGEGDTINLGASAASQYTFRGDVTVPEHVASVRFAITGSAGALRRETLDTSPPYVLHGDDGAGDYFGEPLPPGEYYLSATPYSTAGADGEAEPGVSTTVRFVVAASLPSPQVVSIGGSGAVTEGSSAVFTLTRTGTATEQLTVGVGVTESGTALSGAPPVAVAFARGDTGATLTVPTTADKVVEGNSTVTATLATGTGYIVGSASSASVTVEDDDEAGFRVTAAPEGIAEGESATLAVALANGVTFAEDQTLALAVSGTASPADYTGVPAALTLATGASSATAELAAANDREEEEVETLTVAVSHGGVSIGSATVTITSVSHDATLSALSVSGIDIGAFSGDTTAYAASVAHEVSSTTVTAAASHARASVSISPGTEVSLAEGANEIAVTVTAEDGETTQTYVVTVTRAAAPLSEDASLRTLSLGGVDIGAFSADTVAYAASVAHDVASTTVTATATHSAATVSIEPGSEVSLAVGANEIAVTVTAEDGIATKTYTVTVTRAAAPALPVVSIAAVEERVAGPVGEFTVSRTGPTAEALDVQVLFANSRSSRTQTLTIRFLPGRSSVTTRVQAGDNNLVEDDITVTYTLREGEGYTVSAEHGSASVVVEESDIPEFSVSARPAEIAEGESATVAVAITNGVRFREAQTIDLSVSGTASGSDHTGVPATLTLRAYGTSTTTATLTAELDGEDEAAETVTITASHGGSEIGSATVAIAGSTTPLTGRFAKMPATHDGDTRFGFELHFSEAIRISYRTLRDGAFTVTGGAVREARRLAPPSNLGWEITVEPASDADMVLVLPATTDCAAAGAVCTAAGKRLSGRLTATVRGPATQAAGPGFPLAPENGRPSGIWSDGATAWVADVDDGKLFAYRLSDGSRAPGRDVAVGGSPMGLWSDGGTLWVAELTGGLAAYRLADGSRLPGRDLAPAVSASPVGVWSDGETVWIAEWLGDTVHGYRLSDGERAPARDIRLAAGNLLPVGLWSDGETLWVADWDERMVAYRLSDGERAPERDVAAQGPDADPSGLWSDGETLLATGWAGGEVRAHALPAAAGRAVAAARGGEPGAVPPIGDPALRAAIVAALGAEAGAAGLAGLEVLDARDGGIRSLAGLEGAVDLKELDLGFNPLDDTQALAKLVSLRSLNLDGAAPDLAVLGSLTGLERLSLRHNGVSDLGPLAALAQLAELDVGDNRIEDLRPLMALQALAVLRADRNRIVDLRPLASLPGLERLSLRSNGVSDLGPLAALTQLGELDVGDNRIEDLWPLASLPRLAVVDLAGNRIRDLQPPAAPDLTALASLPGLERLSLRSSGVSDLGPLAALARLRELDVGDNRIEDLRPLAALRALAVLRADRNRIADLRPLASLSSLAVVDLGRNRIRDLRPLAALDRLRTLRLDGNGISAPGPLAGLAGVRELGLAGNAVGDLGALSGLAGLRRLDLRGNPVTDLGPLRGLPSLGWVHVGASGIADLRPLDGAAELTLAGVDDRETPHGDRHRTRPTPGN